MTEQDDKVLRQLEEQGEAEVRRRLMKNEYGSFANPNRLFVQEWLRSIEVEREGKRSSEALSIARDANAIARSADATANEALRIARPQYIVAIIAAIAAVVAAIASIIGLFH
jgi:hypothetical protein